MIWIYLGKWLNSPRSISQIRNEILYSSVREGRETSHSSTKHSRADDQSTPESLLEESQRSYPKISQVPPGKNNKGTFQLEASQAHCHSRWLTPAPVVSGRSQEQAGYINSTYRTVSHTELSITSQYQVVLVQRIVIHTLTHCILR